jgi:hypothetical protein
MLEVGLSGGLRRLKAKQQGVLARADSVSRWSEVGFGVKQGDVKPEVLEVPEWGKEWRRHFSTGTTKSELSTITFPRLKQQESCIAELCHTRS